MQVKFEKYIEESGTARSGKPYTKGTIIGKSTDQYKDLVVFTTFDNNIQFEMKDLAPGTLMDVEFNLKSREWTNNGNTKFFTDAVAYRVQVVGSAPVSSQAAQKQSAPKPETAPVPADDKYNVGQSDEDPDLPF